MNEKWSFQLIGKTKCQQRSNMTFYINLYWKKMLEEQETNFEY